MPTASSSSLAQLEKYLAPVFGVVTALLYFAAFPPLDVAEAAYLFAVPWLLWMMRTPGWKLTLITAGATGFVSWFALLFWLRHVTWVGTILVAAILAVFFLTWAAGSRWLVPRLLYKNAGVRLLGMAALAGLWVVLEWIRSWLFTGFPWLPLAASQWQRPSVLQVAPYTGAWGISFLLVFFNAGIALYVHRLFQPRRNVEWWRRFSPEFYAAFGLLMATFAFVLNGGYFHRARERIFAAGVAQPYVMPDLKWDKERVRENIESLERNVTFAAHGADVVFIPEAATPWPIIGYEPGQQWVENFSAELDVPLIMGTLAAENYGDGVEDNETYYNIVAVVQPTTGVLEKPYYAKRKLVPFGEYVPFGGVLSFLDRIVPIPDTAPGEGPQILPLVVDGKRYNVGPLICYEDIFPQLARETAMEGADFLFVATNNAWYGEEAGAYQHAAHSVLRAVETRHPVLRAGNGGWSGWIDEFGNIRNILRMPDADIYFEGAEVMEFHRDPRYKGHITLYMLWGDWFVLVAAGLAAAGFFLAPRMKANPPTPPESAKEKTQRILKQRKLGRR